MASDLHSFILKMSDNHFLAAEKNILVHQMRQNSLILTILNNFSFCRRILKSRNVRIKKLFYKNLKNFILKRFIAFFFKFY